MATLAEGVLEAMVEARVGGAFWGERHRGFAVVGREGITIPDAFKHEVVGIVAAREGRRARSPLLPFGTDPWTLLAGARSAHAEADDELAIVAGLLDVPVYGPGGERIAPKRLRDSARAALSGARYRNCFTGADASLEEAITLLSDWRRQIEGNQGLSAASGMAFWKREAIAGFLWDGRCSPPFLAPAHGLRRARQDGGALAVWPSRVQPELVAQAEAEGIAVARVEDGFLRSRGLGAALHPPGSVVVDRSGLYYDARRESDLERLLGTHHFPAPLIERARRLRERLCATGVTKYGGDAGEAMELPRGRRTVLVVGQVDDDLSVQLGGAGVTGNLDFLERARRAEPDAWIIYRPHPDVQAGHRRGHLSEAAILAHANQIDHGAPLMALVQAVDAVHVLSSLTGFEALMRGRPVTVHGMPFYAGWGLTRDLAAPTGRRNRTLGIDQLVAGALILYPHYLDPLTRLPCGPEVMVERMASGAVPQTTWLIRLRGLQGKLRRLMISFAEGLNG